MLSREVRKHATDHSRRKDFMGECDKKTTFEILDYFYESGGNFIDTANNYQVIGSHSRVIS